MKTLLKCSTLLLLCAFTAAAHAALQDPLEWKFKVYLDDREIGFHDFTVSNSAGRTRVDIDARFNVRFLFINAYQYQHRNAEIWEDNCLQEIKATTNDNGKRLTVQGNVEGDGFTIRSSVAEAEFGACPMSFAYWNPELLGATQLLNSQTGELQDVVVTARGEDEVRYGGATLPALRYDLEVDGQEISLWYGADDHRWLALEAPARGNRLLRYEPVLLPAEPLADTHQGGF